MKYVFGGGETYRKIIDISSDKNMEAVITIEIKLIVNTNTQNLNSIFPNFIFNVF